MCIYCSHMMTAANRSDNIVTLPRMRCLMYGYITLAQGAEAANVYRVRTEQQANCTKRSADKRLGIH